MQFIMLVDPQYFVFRDQLELFIYYYD